MPELDDMFVTDVYEQVLYLNESVGLSDLGKISLVANLRLRPGYTTLRVPSSQLSSLIKTLRVNKERDSRNRVGRSTKPTPPDRVPNSQLTRTERRVKYGFGFAPMRDWWPVTQVVGE